MFILISRFSGSSTFILCDIISRIHIKKWKCSIYTHEQIWKISSYPLVNGYLKTVRGDGMINYCLFTILHFMFWPLRNQSLSLNIFYVWRVFRSICFFAVMWIRINCIRIQVNKIAKLNSNHFSSLKKKTNFKSVPKP